MVPLDLDGKAWSKSSVDMLTEKIRAEVDAELRARDVSRGLSAENGYKAYVSDSNGRYVVDQELARNKHTGRERRLLCAKRMAEFCMEPQSEAEFLKSYVMGDKRKQGLQKWIDRADEEIPTASPRVELQSQPLDNAADGQVRRGPGRPRKREALTV